MENDISLSTVTFYYMPLRWLGENSDHRFRITPLQWKVDEDEEDFGGYARACDGRPSLWSRSKSRSIIHQETKDAGERQWEPWNRIRSIPLCLLLYFPVRSFIAPTPIPPCVIQQDIGGRKIPPISSFEQPIESEIEHGTLRETPFLFSRFFFAIQAPGSDKARSASSISTLKVYNKVVMADARPLLALPLGPEETEEDQGEEPIRLATRRLLKSLCVFCICSLLRRAPIWCDLRSFVLRLLNAPKEEYILCRRNSSLSVSVSPSSDGRPFIHKS